MRNSPALLFDWVLNEIEGDLGDTPVLDHLNSVKILL